MNGQEKVSIIIRAKNEADWLVKTLPAIQKQTYKNVEIVLVDNHSTDDSVAIAKQYNCILTSVDQYRPGNAINVGIRASSGAYLVILSAHCVPCDEFWLENLMKGFRETNNVAGVYGRQLPLPFTSPYDKRDLAITFGIEKKIQYKDSFFHNANSVIRRDVWKQHPFDEDVTNIEDRIWARQVQQHGYCLVYQPEARVFHYHGIHQYGNEARCLQTVNILESIEDFGQDVHRLDKWAASDVSEIIAFVPVAPFQHEVLLQKPVGFSQTYMELMLKEVIASRFVDQCVVMASDPTLQGIASSVGCSVFAPAHPFDSLEGALQGTLCHVRDTLNLDPVYIMYLKPTHVCRTRALIDELVHAARSTKNVDTIFCAKEDYKAVWAHEDGTLVRKDEGFHVRDKKNPLWSGYTGLGSITKAQFIEAGRRMGDSLSVLRIQDAALTLDIAEPSEKKIVDYIFPHRFTS